MADYHTPPLIPPFRFNVVESNVFRGGYPKQRNLRFMKRLQLKTWIALVPDPPAEHLVRFCELENVNLVHFKVAKPKENVTLSFSRATRVLQLLVDTENLPVYIHCLDGTSVTGLVVACLRRLQLWDLRCAMTEFCRFASLESDEKTFVERFHGDMLIPDRQLPDWLWNGGQLVLEKHPSLPKLRFERVERDREARAQAAKEAREAAKEAMRRRINAELLRDPSTALNHEYIMSSTGPVGRMDDSSIISPGIMQNTGISSSGNGNHSGSNPASVASTTLASNTPAGSGAGGGIENAALAGINTGMATMNMNTSMPLGSLTMATSSSSTANIMADGTGVVQEARPRRPDGHLLSRTLSSLALEALDID